MRAQDPGILELLHTNISCTTSSISVYAHILILYNAQEVIVFMSIVLAVEYDPPTPPGIYSCHN